MFLHTLHHCRRSACHIEINDTISLERQIHLCVLYRWGDQRLPLSLPEKQHCHGLRGCGVRQKWNRHPGRGQEKGSAGHRQQDALCAHQILYWLGVTCMASIGAAERSFKRSCICQHCPLILSPQYKIYRSSLVSPREEKLVQKWLLTIDRL